jgi:radical SAM/Cys-rich protein
MTLTLLRQNNRLTDARVQRGILEGDLQNIASFAVAFEKHGIAPMRARAIDVLQVNVGKVCNQTCTHCHVDAGPDRRESMSRETAELVIETLQRHEIATLDITGGAPEMNPHFRYLVEQATALSRRVIDRCNLTILTTNGHKDLPEFLAKHRVEVVASLPCYLESNCDHQRGDGVFKRSIEAIRTLNDLGYGKPESGLRLNLVYNPVGPSLPPDQQRLEADYRRELKTRYDIVFNSLHTITNLPISRFLDDLLSQGRFEDYMRKLVDSFNPLTVEGVMCRDMVSVDWQGYLYDCDFNQMLEMRLDGALPNHLRDFNSASLSDRIIQTGRHCFGCTAGNGSSCQGAVISG